MRIASRVAVAIVATAISIIASSTLALAAPTSWEAVDVTVHAEQGNATMLVSGTLPEGTKLPAEVELPVPAGSQFQWAGEILGGPVDQDPSVQYTTTTRDGSDIYSFRLTESLIGQLEVIPAGLVISTADGYQSNLTWTANSDVKELRLNYRLPQTAKVVTPAAGASMSPGPTGYNYYSKTIQDVKAGQTESLAFGYSPVTAAPATSAGTTGASDTVALVLVLGAALAFFAFFAMKVSRKMQAKSGATSTPMAAARASEHQGAGDVPAEDGTAPAVDRESEAPPVRAGRKPAVILGLVVGVLGAVVLVALSNGGKAAVSGDTVMLTVAQVDACSQSNIPLSTPPGGDLARDANDILGLLKSVSGVGNATIYLSQSMIEVNYCESSTDEARIRASLAPSGYVAASTGVSSTSAATTLASDGKIQTLDIDASTGPGFAPAQISAKAGVPIEIDFSQGEGCLDEVVFDQFGIRQSLAAGPTTVKLPALEPGTYAFNCGMGHQEGSIVVQ